MRIPAGGQGRGPFDSESPRGQVFWGFSYDETALVYLWQVRPDER